MSRMQFPLRLSKLAMALALIAAAATSQAAPWDGGVVELQDSIQSLVAGAQGGQVLLPRPGMDIGTEVANLLKSPMSADAAVRIAVLNNPDLQRELGSAGRSISDASASNNPVKIQVRQSITLLTSKVYKAWVRAVAAEQAVLVLADAKDTLQTSGELSRRMAQVGNLSKLNQARAQLALSEAAIALAQAQSAAFSARESLILMLGLWGDQTRFELPTDLPPLPARAQSIDNVEERAMAARVDLVLSRAEWQRKLATAVPSGVDDRWDGLGDAAKVRASAVALRSQARQVYFAYRSAYDLAQHMQTEVLPLRSFVHDEMVLRYNGMLSSIFEVLADSHASVVARHAALAAQRDFWLAQADLQALMLGAVLEELNSATATAVGGAPGATAGPAH